jgi:hypothetical protein
LASVFYEITRLTWLVYEPVWLVRWRRVIETLRGSVILVSAKLIELVCR